MLPHFFPLFPGFDPFCIIYILFPTCFQFSPFLHSLFSITSPLSLFLPLFPDFAPFPPFLPPFTNHCPTFFPIFPQSAPEFYLIFPWILCISAPSPTLDSPFSWFCPHFLLICAPFFPFSLFFPSFSPYLFPVFFHFSPSSPPIPIYPFLPFFFIFPMFAPISSPFPYFPSSLFFLGCGFFVLVLLVLFCLGGGFFPFLFHFPLFFLSFCSHFCPTSSPIFHFTPLPPIHPFSPFFPHLATAVCQVPCPQHHQ